VCGPSDRRAVPRTYPPGVLAHLVETAGRPVGLLRAWQDDDACGLDLFVAASGTSR